MPHRTQPVPVIRRIRAIVTMLVVASACVREIATAPPRTALPSAPRSAELQGDCTGVVSAPDGPANEAAAPYHSGPYSTPVSGAGGVSYGIHIVNLTWASGCLVTPSVAWIDPATGTPIYFGPLGYEFSVGNDSRTVCVTMGQIENGDPATCWRPFAIVGRNFDQITVYWSPSVTRRPAIRNPCITQDGRNKCQSPARFWPSVNIRSAVIGDRA